MKKFTIGLVLMNVLVLSGAKAKEYTEPKEIADIVYNIREIEQRLNALNAVVTNKIKVSKINMHRALQVESGCFYAYSVEFGNLSKEDEAIIGKSYWTNNDRDGKNQKCLYKGTGF